MKKLVLLAVMATLGAGLCFADAPVEEAQAYFPKQENREVAEQTDPAETVESTPKQEEGFSLTHLPHQSWKNSEDTSSDEPVRLALNDELTPARDSTTTNMSSEQRLLYLSQQMDNLTNMNLPSEINDLQQQVAQLRGQLQDQDRTIKMLQAQQENFYENVNSKLKQLQDQITTPASSSASLNAGVKSDNASTVSALTSMDGMKPVQASDTEAYQIAFNSLMDKHYAKAREGFNAYLQNYPQGKYSGNVNYWLGEIALLEQRYPQAEAAFSEVVNRFQDSGKAEDARYKLAITHLKMGKTAKAKDELLAIQKQSAGNSVARLAKLQLQQLS